MDASSLTTRSVFLIFSTCVAYLNRCCLAGYLMIGACANQFLTDVGKHTVGRLRPHFYDLCQPSVACTEANSHQYIADYNCTRTSHPDIPQDKFEDRLLDAR